MRRSEPAQAQTNSVSDTALPRRPKVYEVPLKDEWLVSNQLSSVDYADAFTVEVDPALSDDPQWWIDHVFAHPPKPVVAMLWFRNVVMKPFGVKRGKADPQGGKSDEVFTPLEANDREIVMGTDDKHLNFRASILVEQLGQRQTVTMTTVVKFNNVFGRLYFVPVGPIHKYVVIPMTLRHAARWASAS